MQEGLFANRRLHARLAVAQGALLQLTGARFLFPRRLVPGDARGLDGAIRLPGHREVAIVQRGDVNVRDDAAVEQRRRAQRHAIRSEEHTSELQSLMRISYAVFCLKTKTKSQIVNE